MIGGGDDEPDRQLGGRQCKWSASGAAEGKRGWQASPQLAGFVPARDQHASVRVQYAREKGNGERGQTRKSDEEGGKKSSWKTERAPRTSAVRTPSTDRSRRSPSTSQRKRCVAQGAPRAAASWSHERELGGYVFIYIYIYIYIYI